jgi:DNA invertase Pin-like site-specific DNA recombinase
VIAKLDRLARNQTFLMSLVDSGVDVLFCDLPEIPAGAMGRFLIQSMAAVAELEAGLISERTKAALRAKVERDGQWDRKGTPNLIPGAGQQAAAEAVRQKADEFTADRLPLIVIMQQEGLSLHQIAASLNDQGVTTARGGMWYATTVRNALLRAA